MAIIEDGTGNGFKMEVDSNKRAQVRSVSENILTRIGNDGGAFTVNTGIIPCNTALEKPVIYIKNNGTQAVALRAATVYSKKSNEDTGTNNTKQTFTLRIVAGIISHDLSTPVTATATRASRAKDLDISIFSGGDSNSMTYAATVATIFFQAGGITSIADGESFFTLEAGSEIGVTLQPSGGNTDCDVVIGATFFLDDGSL